MSSVELEGEAIEIATGKRLSWKMFSYILLATYNRVGLVSFKNECSLEVCIFPWITADLLPCNLVCQEQSTHFFFIALWKACLPLNLFVGLEKGLSLSVTVLLWNWEIFAVKVLLAIVWKVCSTNKSFRRLGAGGERELMKFAYIRKYHKTH